MNPTINGLFATPGPFFFAIPFQLHEICTTINQFEIIQLFQVPGLPGDHIITSPVYRGS